MHSRFLLAAMSAIFLMVTPSFAQWTGAEREEFTKECLEACRKNPNISEARRPQCVDYCECVMESAERIEPKYKVLNDDFIKNRDTDRVRSVKGTVPACNRKAFPAR